MAIYTNEHLTDLLNDEYEKVRRLEQELQRLKSNFARYENIQILLACIVIFLSGLFIGSCK